jgi:ribosomal-protein-alanine N-acetyltransferase
MSPPTGQQITCFPLREDHLPDVLAIEQASFPEPWSEGMFLREIRLPISCFYIARFQDRIAGYGGYWQVEDEAHIVSLAVHPDCRSRGIGRQILHFLMDGMRDRGIIRILLEVRAGNQPAQRLYGSEGFTAIGRREKYYGNEDAIVMEKKLEPVAAEQPPHLRDGKGPL